MPNGTLNDIQLKAVTYIDQKFWETGHVPTNEVLAEVFPMLDAKAFWKTPHCRAALIARGIRLEEEGDVKGVLTPQQVICANIMMNIHDKRSVREKLKEVPGVTVQKWNGWLREPAFNNYLKKRAEALFESTDSEAYKQLAAKVQDGDFNALKLHFEMRNIYNPRLDINVNINQILSKVVEIVAVHVNDPDTLEAIADAIEELVLEGPSSSSRLDNPFASNSGQVNQAILNAGQGV